MGEAKELAVSALAERFAALMQRLGGEDEVLRGAAQRLIHAVRAGHGCLDLRRANLGLSADEVRRRLGASAVVGRAGEEEHCPILIDGHRLYLQKFYDQERLIARRIFDLCPRKATAEAPDAEGILAAVAEGTDPGQREAIRKALGGGFTVLTGGPGTGKTTTAVRVIAAYHLLAEATGQSAPRIALAAPTGKAAARLVDSIKTSCQRGVVPTALSERIVANIDARKFTLHRLLGFSRSRGLFTRGPDNPLNFDVVLVDEASMCSLTLMARLLAALPPEAKLVLLGDKDQLASVDAGAVLADICQAGLSGRGALAGRIAELTQNHRSAEAPRIVAAAEAVRRADSERLMQALDGMREWQDDLQSFYARIDHCAHEYFAPIAAAATVEEAFAVMNRFRILAATKVGPLGVDAINRRVRRELGFPEHAHYRGEPVIAMVNDYDLKVFNGDVGMIWDDGSTPGKLAAWFLDDENRLRPLPLARFAALQPFYATTVHKSQGSEFAHVFFVLPEDSAGAARELVYTAITRASRELTVWASPASLRAAIEKPTVRHLGLAERLSH